jgi:hypothetical protein
MPILKNIKPLFNFRIITLLHCFIISSCAVISSPTGGERDQKAPKVLAENPKNQSTNFNNKEINILFDEWITLQNPQNILITPDVEPKPKVIAKRNELNIQFKNQLDSNTTYSIFFGNELKDNNEGNPLENYAYVFSTGSYIDSISIEGKLQNLSDKLEPNTFVLLYKDLNDTAFITKKPHYITKINTDGSFKLQHLKKGQYKIYALEDKNSNYYYDLSNEKIGFLDSILTIDSNTNNIQIPLFLPEEQQLRIVQKDKSILNNMYNITWNKDFSVKEDQFQVLTKDSTAAIAFPEEKNLKIYFPNLKKDTGEIQFFILHNDKIIDSVETKIENKKTPILFFDTTTTKNLKTFESHFVELLSKQHSIENIDTNKIYILDTLLNKITFNITKKDNLKTYIINPNWKATQKHKIVFEDSCLQDLAGNFNKKQEIFVLVEENKKSGNLLINIDLDTILPNLIFILKDNQGMVQEKQNLRNSQTFKINIGLTQAGTYNVEIIKDDNENEIWNSGNYSKKTLPEKIYKHTPIIVKENWDAEETIKPNFNQQSKTTETNIKNTDFKNNNTNEEPNFLPTQEKRIQKNNTK